MNKSLAVIIPVYRSKETVRELVEAIKEEFCATCSYHIYLVDDGNGEEIRNFLVAHCLQENVTLIVLKENYGQQNAVLCGLRHSLAYDYVAVMDDDLAHPVAVLKTMYEKMAEGYELVYGTPEENPQYTLGSRVRDWLFRWVLSCPKGKRVSSFRVMKSEVAREVVKWEKTFFYFSATALQKFQNIENVEYVPVKSTRSSGYTFGKRVTLFIRILWYYCLPFASKESKKPLYEVSEIYPKLMVLGGSNCQLHALERAKQEGMYTVLADYTTMPPGAAVADVHEKISTFDAEACLDAARRHHIQGVMTMGTDQPVLTAAKVSDALGLPSCLSTEQALYVTNKKYMKQRLQEAEILTSPWMLVDKNTTEEEIAKLTPPYVLKPLDSQGQRGIFKLNTPQEVLEHLEETLSFSRCEEALLEEFYESEEVTVSGYVSKGRLIILTITDRLLYPDPVHIGVCIGHRFPSVHMGRYGEIRGISEGLVKAFRIPEGPFYLQLLVGEKGIRVNELACRIGGAFEDVMIPWLTGFDFLGAVIKNALGRPVDASQYYDFRCDELEKAASVQLLFCHPGTIASVTDKKIIQGLPGVLDSGYNYQPGSTILKMENATARFGHAVIVGTKDTIGQNIQLFYDTLSVRSTEGMEMLHRLYPEQ